jgi:hypothetical protein
MFDVLLGISGAAGILVMIVANVLQDTLPSAAGAWHSISKVSPSLMTLQQQHQ